MSKALLNERWMTHADLHSSTNPVTFIRESNKVTWAWFTLGKSMLTLPFYLLVPRNLFQEYSLHVFFQVTNGADQPVDLQTVFLNFSEDGCNISSFLFLGCFSFLFIWIMKSGEHTLVTGYLFIYSRIATSQAFGNCSKLPLPSTASQGSSIFTY